MVVNGGPVNQTIAWSEVSTRSCSTRRAYPCFRCRRAGIFGNPQRNRGRSQRRGRRGLSEPNGSYPFVVTPPSGWSVSPASGMVLVHGAGEVQTLNFSEVILPLAVNFTYPYLWTCGERINVTFTSDVTGGSSGYSYLWNLGDGSRHRTKRIPLTVCLLVLRDGGQPHCHRRRGTMAIYSETLYVHIGNCTNRFIPPPNEMPRRVRQSWSPSRS